VVLTLQLSPFSLLDNILLNIVIFSNQARKERHLFLLQRLEQFFVLVKMNEFGFGFTFDFMTKWQDFFQKRSILSKHITFCKTKPNANDFNQ